MNNLTKDWIPLWPGSAPFAQGSGYEDVPAIKAYPVPNDKGRGLVIVCPGGGYGGRADHEGEPIAQWLNAIGIPAVVLRYRVAPYKYPSALTDVQRAIRYVRHHADSWGIDGNKIGVLGFSAGGHLTASAATQYDHGNPAAEDAIDRLSSRPDAAILCYPVITTKKPYTHDGSMLNLLGEDPDPELIASLSCEDLVTSDTPPTFIWHTADDGPVPVENALLFAGALSRAKVPFDLHVYEHGPHGMGLATSDEHVANWTTACGLWLKRRAF